MLSVAKINISDDVMIKLSSYLEEGMGLHYTRDRWPDLEKRMRPVAKILGFNNLNDCIQSILSKPINPNLITVLAYHLTIGETYFFRDQKRMEALQTKILPEIIKRHSQDKKIRIWSVACCSGEEPYSIAIMLDGLIPQRENWDISIFGSDINKEFLRKAEGATYTKWSFRATPKDVRSKYFISHKNDVYTLIPKIKKMVNFSYFNIIEDTYSSKYNEMDLIMCHNVLIYFSPKQIKKAIYQLSNTIIKDGWLSISAIETPFVSEPHLAVRSFEGAIFFQRSDKAQDTREEKMITPMKPMKEDEALLKVAFPEFIKLEQPVIEFPLTAKKPEVSIPKVESELGPKLEIDLEDLYSKKRYREIISELGSIRGNVEFLKNNPAKVLMLIRTYANLGELNEALDLCEAALKVEKLDPNLHYIYATIRMAKKDPQEAIKSLKSVLFLEPNHIAAHFLMGTLQQQIDQKSAKKSFKIALDLLQDFEPDEKLNGAEELTAYRVKDIIENSLRSFHEE